MDRGRGRSAETGGHEGPYGGPAEWFHGLPRPVWVRSGGTVTTAAEGNTRSDEERVMGVPVVVAGVNEGHLRPQEGGDVARRMATSVANHPRTGDMPATPERNLHRGGPQRPVYSGRGSVATPRAAPTGSEPGTSPVVSDPSQRADPLRRRDRPAKWDEVKLRDAVRTPDDGCLPAVRDGS